MFPESSEDKIKQQSDDVFDVRVRAAAQNGHANREVIHLLSKHFNAGVKLVSGGTRSHKIFEVTGK
ncbi:DUF167 domain-containing protein [Candidatus Nomurabacteria bacterium]|nr:DUF167 domain-containing protein [Candidatus Nomurabacteria bacterium]